MTPKQKQFLKFLSNYQRRYGFPPTQREIAAGLNFKSVGTVQDYKNRLRNVGLIDSNLKVRGLKVLDRRLRRRNSESSGTVELLLAGKVSAGLPIEPIENQDSLQVPGFLVGPGPHFALQVVGHSMIDEGIMNEDYVIIRKQSTADSGQNIVATIDGEATIKKFFIKSGRIQLQPANPKYKLIEVKPTQDFRIQGVVVGLVRSYKS